MKSKLVASFLLASWTGATKVEQFEENLKIWRLSD
jgi:hypothetical protein